MYSRIMDKNLSIMFLSNACVNYPTPSPLCLLNLESFLKESSPVYA